MKPRDKASPISRLMVGQRKFVLNLLYIPIVTDSHNALKNSKYAFTIFSLDHLHVNTDVIKYLPQREEDDVGVA